MLTLLVVAAGLLALGASDDDIFLGEKHKPGFVKFENGDDMFYWLFYSRDSRATDPLTIWLSGGPGCASEMSVLYENGPFLLQDDSTLAKNPYSWNNNANLLYLDQPVGTGFSGVASDSDYRRTEAGVAQDFVYFLQKFLELNPEFKGRDLYITGESYGGHYVPAVSAHLRKQGSVDLNLKAVAIGNGWTNPYEQYPTYASFSYENGLIGELRYYALEAGRLQGVPESDLARHAGGG